MNILHWLSVAANLITALSYFWIPTQSFLYLNQSQVGLDGIDRRLVWTESIASSLSGFDWLCYLCLPVAFNHLVMGLHLISGLHEFIGIQVLADLVMAIVSAQSALRIRGFLRLILPILPS